MVLSVLTSWFPSQYGRVEEARTMLEEKHIPLYQKVAAATNAGYVLNMIIPNVFVSQQLHILGASKEVFTAFFCCDTTYIQQRYRKDRRVVQAGAGAGPLRPEQQKWGFLFE